MPMKFKIHPAIGIARLGNSEQFCLSPETPGGLPFQCDQGNGIAIEEDGVEVPVEQFKENGRILRQGARFRVFASEDGGEEKELRIGQTIEFVNGIGQLVEAELLDVQWTVYLANKKSSWYQFKQLEGEHGYEADHPLRNRDVHGDERQRLVIDPGPQSVSRDQPRASFAEGENPDYPQSFPPPLEPFSIHTLGDLLLGEDEEKRNRLVVLGGYGCSGSYKSEFPDPVIKHYANNEGWFDDTSDGPVTARLSAKIIKINGQEPTIQKGVVSVDVDVPAWVIVGYPAYVPQILDMITMEDCLRDVFVREFAADPEIYGVPPFDGDPEIPTDKRELELWRKRAQWNSDYYPYFWRDIWPLIKRPQDYQWVLDFDPFTGGDPHNTTMGFGGNFDPDQISVPPHHGQDPVERELFAQKRRFVYSVVRKETQGNLFAFSIDESRPNERQIGMPYLCGDNPLSNTVPQKFLRLTETQIFLLRQWSQGKFVNEKTENLVLPELSEAARLDRGVLSNLLGGAFCPGGEAAWIVRNPAVYSAPYRIKLSSELDPQSLLPKNGQLSLSTDFEVGFEPGDITKYSALPWQADFNECSIQNVDITYEDWNKISLENANDPAKPVVQPTFWWPSHRPLQVSTSQGSKPWSRGIPQSNTGDLMMVTAWSALGFVVDVSKNPEEPSFLEVERNKNLLP